MTTRIPHSLRDAQSQQAVIIAVHEFLENLEAGITDEIDLNIAMQLTTPFAPRQISMQRLIEIESFFSAACLKLGELGRSSPRPRIGAAPAAGRILN